jgi:YD repeat-containing protein
VFLYPNHFSSPLLSIYPDSDLPCRKGYLSALSKNSAKSVLITLLRGFFCCVLSVAAFAQSMAPRPLVEGYAFLGGITKDPYLGAKMACDYIDKPSHDMYVYGEITASTFSDASSAPYPFSYAYQCAWTDQETGEEFVAGGSYANWGSHGSSGTYESNTPQACEPTAGNPINIARGEKTQTEEDVSPVNHSPLQLSRYYNSQVTFNQQLGSFGNSWSHTYDRRIVAGSLDKTKPSHILYWRSVNGKWAAVSSYTLASPLPSTDIDYAYAVRANGKSIYHYRNGDTWQTDYGVASTLTLLPNDAGWLFVTDDNSREFYDMSGRLIIIENTLGQTQSLFYELAVADGGDGNTQTLDRVEDSDGNYLSFRYNSNSRLEQVTASNGDAYLYTYDDKGSLSQITYPNMTTRLYHYDNAIVKRLVGITDERGIRYVTWGYDSKGYAVSSEHAGGVDRVTLSYSTANFNLATNNSTRTVTVTNPLGKQTTYHFKALNGLPKITQVEGEPSANCAGANKNYTYDANGFIASKTDWNNNLTTYVHNNRGQELSRTEAAGTPQARTITTEWHSEFNLPIKISEPERETVMTYDANGRLLSREIKEKM